MFQYKTVDVWKVIDGFYYSYKFIDNIGEPYFHFYVLIIWFKLEWNSMDKSKNK